MTDNSPLEPGRQSNQSPPVSASQNLVKWLREAARAAEDVEDQITAETPAAGDYPLETAGFDASEFRLANGNDVKVVFAKFWERLRYQDWREGARPSQYYAIKVYSTEDTLPRCMAIHCEFRGGKDFSLLAVPKVWEWLADLTDERKSAKYDWLEDFIQELAEKIAEFSDTSEDAVEHIEHLAEMIAPDAFDKVDDSLFNDQNDIQDG